MVAETGAGPLALARAQRAQAARILVETTDLPMCDVAYAAGFSSTRQFNDSGTWARPWPAAGACSTWTPTLRPCSTSWARTRPCCPPCAEPRAGVSPVVPMRPRWRCA
jgi:AraC-like DNA-binding protein